MIRHLPALTCAYVALGILTAASDFWWPWVWTQRAMAFVLLLGVAQAGARLLRGVRP